MIHRRFAFSCPRVAALLGLLAILLPAVAASPQEPVYLVGAGDMLEVRVYGEPDLTRSVIVAEDGSIGFPLLGRVPVSGLTVRQIERELHLRLGRDFLVDPHVTVLVSGYHSQRVYVLGAVREPGYYELRGPTTLLEILSRAGGVLPEGGRRLIVVRDGAGSGNEEPGSGESPPAENTHVIDGFKLLQQGDTSQNIPLQDRDVVYVPRAREVFVIGEVTRPGPVIFTENLTLLQAIGQAGGTTEVAAKRRVQLIRVHDDVRESFRYNLNDIIENNAEDIPLLADDVIVVPKRIL